MNRYGYGVIRNGEHIQRFGSREEADTHANELRARLPELVREGWISERSAQETRIWVEEVRGRVW